MATQALPFGSITGKTSAGILVDEHRVGGQPEIVAGLVIYAEANVVEGVVAEGDVVATELVGAEEVRPLDQEVLVVALLGLAFTTERRCAECGVVDSRFPGCTANEVAPRRPGRHRCRDCARSTGLPERSSS